MKKLIFFISLSLLILAGCSVKKDGNFTRVKIDKQRTVWINKDIECCGVKDPVNNLEWLNNKLILEKTTPYSRCVLLFRNNLDSTESIVIKCDHSFSFYDCSGIRFGGGLDYDREYYSILSNINTDILKKTENKRFAIPSRFAAPAPCFKCKHFFNNNTLIDIIAYSIVERKN